jgi:hypothetical protein
MTAYPREYHVRNLKGTPHIHVHHWTGEDHGESKGWMRADLVCHACRTGLVLLYDYPKNAEDATESPELTEARHAFRAHHLHPLRKVQHTLGTTTCPPVTASVTRDLRRYGRWTPLLRRLRIR